MSTVITILKKVYSTKLAAKISVVWVEPSFYGYVDQNEIYEMKIPNDGVSAFFEKCQDGVFRLLNTDQLPDKSKDNEAHHSGIPYGCINDFEGSIFQNITMANLPLNTEHKDILRKFGANIID